MQAIQARALEVPTSLVVACHAWMHAICNFLPHCNPHIQLDAKAGMHLLAGAARAAYQTVLVNHPTEEQKQALVPLLTDVQRMEAEILEL